MKLSISVTKHGLRLTFKIPALHVCVYNPNSGNPACTPRPNSSTINMYLDTFLTL